MMTVMHAPTPDGGSIPMMAMVAKVVGSTSLGSFTFICTIHDRAAMSGRITVR